MVCGYLAGFQRIFPFFGRTYPVGFILFFLFGKEFVFWWTDGKVIPENLFVLAMAIGMVF